MIKRTFRVDNLGRVTIPKSIRMMLGIDKAEVIEVMYDNTQLVIPRVNVLEIDESMDKLINVAGNSGAITYKELNELKEIFDKLRIELYESEVK